MTTTITITGSVTLDESFGLQNSGGAVGSEDNNDSDVSLATLQTSLDPDAAAFSSRLFNTTANGGLGLSTTFATSNGVAESASNLITVSGGSVASLGFVDGSGAALPVYTPNVTDPSTGVLVTGFTALDGGAIHLFEDATSGSGLGNHMALGVDTQGNIVFAVFMDPTADLTSARVWMVQFEAISNPDATNPDDSVNLFDTIGVAVSTEQNFSFAGAPSGSNLFMMFGDPTSTQIVVIGQNPLNQSQGGNITTKDVLNISQAGSTTSFGVNGNAINPDQGAFITYVTGANTNFLVPNLDQNEADVEANIDFQGVFNSTGASFTVNQTNPGVGPVTVKISAFTTAAEPGVNFVDGLTNDTHVNILSASVVDNIVKSGKTQFTPVATVNADGTLTITGLSTGDKVNWTTSGTHNRVLIQNISNADGISGNDNNTFDIGGFSLANSVATSADIGSQLTFEDSGPTAAIALASGSVVHDETSGAQTAGGATDTSSAAVSGLFTNVSNPSQDFVNDDPTGNIYAQSAAAVVTTTGSSPGTDAFGATTALLSLSVAPGGVDSGLTTTDGTKIFLFSENSGSLIVGRIGADAATAASGLAAFAVAIDSSGKLSTAQYASLKHGTSETNGDASESVSITNTALQAKVTVTDGDSDAATQSVNIGNKVQFLDDGPTAAIATTDATVVHDESSGAQTGGGATDTNSATVAALFTNVGNKSQDFVNDDPTGNIYAQSATTVVTSTGSLSGADEEGATGPTFSLSVAAGGVDSGLTTTDGTKIFLFSENSGSLIVGRIGADATTAASGQAAFAVAIDSSSGVLSMAQYASLHHGTASNGDTSEAVSITNTALQAKVTVTDGDGDKATQSVDIGNKVQFLDDGPAIGPIDNSVVAFATDATGTATKTLNGVVGADQNTTPYTIDTFTTDITINGTALKGVISADKETVTYYADTNKDTIFGNTGDTAFYRLQLSETANSGAGSYTFTVLQNPPPTELNFNFAGAPSGSNLFMMFGDPTSAEIVVIGQNPLNQSQGGNITTKDVLNISQAGSTTSFGVNGNAINPDEGAFITYVTGADTNFLVPNLDQNEADIEANIAFQGVFNSNSASFTVNQTNPGVGPVTIKISAFTTAAEPGVNFVDGLTNDTHVDILSASVVDNIVKSGKTQFTPVATVNADGTLTITGLSTGDKVTWTTSGTHDRVLIQNISNADGITGNDNNTFDIGGFSLTQTQATPDQKLDFVARATDGDGDFNTASFSIGIDGTGINHDGHVVGVG